MFKKVEVLNKDKFKAMKYADLKAVEVAKQTGIIPVGFNEVIDMAYFAPIVIMGRDESLEFVAFTGVSEEISIFNKENTFIPIFPKTYPFINMIVKDEKEELRNVIGIDNDKHVAKRKKNFIFNKKNELQKLASEKIEQVKELNRQRDISRRIIQELKQNDLLLEKDFKINFDKEEKVILDKFYVINRAKLVSLDDSVLSVWAKKGWMSIFDCHLKSLANFQKVMTSTK